MKATAIWLGALLIALGGASAASANPNDYPMPRVGPDACSGPGYYVVSPGGMVYGPNYYLWPAPAPFNGMRPAQNGCGSGGGTPRFPTHPYARSPRDFFMLD